MRASGPGGTPGARWPVASGLLLALAHPPFHLLVPSFVALVPFAVWLEGLPEGEAGRRAALRGGFLLGLVYFGLVFYWLVVALIYYTWLAVLAFLAPLLILSGFLAAATLGAHLTRRRLGWPAWLALPVFWTAMEWLRAHLGDVSFPWMGLGDTLTGFPWLIGSADLVGSRGLTLWLALINALLAGAWLARRDPPRRRRLALAAAAVVALPAGYSLLRWTTLETRPAARVVVVQPNVPEDIKLERAAAVDSARAAVEWLLATLPAAASPGRPPLDLLALPETTLPVYLDPIPGIGYRGRPDLEAWVSDLARRLEAGVLVGTLGSRDLGGGEYEYFNSALLVGADGERRGVYHKRHLVPIVERVPFVDPRLFRGLDYFGGFGVGRDPRPLEAEGSRFGPLICYESIFAGLSRRHRRNGAEFLVNITNDAWFGREEPWWSRSSALWQHPAHLVMRAIENRMGAVRSANTGISGIVDPRGRFTHRTPLFAHAAFAAEVATTEGLTLYARTGDVPGPAAALAALAAVVLLARRRPAAGGGG